MQSELVSEEIILTIDKQEQAVFAARAARVGIDVDGLANSGCGHRVDNYTVWACAEQGAGLNAMLYPALTRGSHCIAPTIASRKPSGSGPGLGLSYHG